MSTHPQKGVLLPAGKAAEASQVELPSLQAGADASELYAHLFGTVGSSKEQVKIQELPINACLPSEDRLLLVHASSSTASTSDSQPENRLASEVLLEQLDCSASIHGKAYLLYAQAGKDLRLRQDWQALHDVCYGARLANVRKADSNKVNLEKVAEQFIAKRDGASESKEVKMEEDTEEDGGDWTDEEVEKPREPTKEVDSDDDGQEMNDNEAAGEEDEEDEEEEVDSEGSYEDESELESDDDDDPRKKALLEMIQAAIMKDGKLDLERLGLVEKNGKLVPKDDSIAS